jgi:hypothetical protein
MEVMRTLLAVVLLLALVLPVHAGDFDALLYTPVTVWADRDKTKTIGAVIVGTHSVERKEYVPILFVLVQRDDGNFEWWSILEVKTIPKAVSNRPPK